MHNYYNDANYTFQAAEHEMIQQFYGFYPRLAEKLRNGTAKFLGVKELLIKHAEYPAWMSYKDLQVQPEVDFYSYHIDTYSPEIEMPEPYEYPDTFYTIEELEAMSEEDRPCFLI